MPKFKKIYIAGNDDPGGITNEAQEGVEVDDDDDDDSDDDDIQITIDHNKIDEAKTSYQVPMQIAGIIRILICIEIISSTPAPQILLLA